ncbi:MAG TPA: hypothetical protein VNB06_17540 [Thermoanaerobaculia bacterium]|nr:hypothetical protein [Thermoanaerobaculia bacterium]
MPPELSSFRACIIASSAAFLLLSFSAPVGAQGWDFGVRTGIYTDIEEPFLGVEALHQIRRTPWMFNPNVEYVFVEHGSLWALSADVHYDFDLDMEKVDVWAGGGPTVLLRDSDARRIGPDRDSNDFGLNLIAGAGVKRGSVRPYGQIKVILSDDTEVALQVGLRFN